ncbi:MAG: tRNA (adenosine(37)-N6)-threonylcarbamoyltransferase complex transferase subunit TsaD [Rickettsiales bacterium]|nr:tRNA (adenosine(37)-N6)-threonylcarbamoyltransferase complex transferase subunit TsaD [Rickettsiales bacterium]
MPSPDALVLGIESSCDETAIAIVKGDRTIIAQALRSQTEAHQAYGGVVPEIAARQHMQHIEQLLQQALTQAQLGIADMDAIAATAGPGLIGGVIVGLMTAKALASVHRKPLYAINHLEGHALTARLSHAVTFPYLLLLMSGGHCQVLAVEAVGRYRKLGSTRDDALGEAFDKTAKMMGLPYPGGPQIEAIAKGGDALRFHFPLPFVGEPHGDFSFSGLKTAVRRQVVALGEAGALDHQAKADIAASFQHCVARILEDRLHVSLRHFFREYGSGHALVIAGGVAANQALRVGLHHTAQSYGMSLVAPPMALCTDNAAMIAWAGLERLSTFPPDALDVLPRARWALCD